MTPRRLDDADVDVLRHALDILRRVDSWPLDWCSSCGHRRDDHLGRLDGQPIGCVGNTGHCPRGCMRFTAAVGHRLTSEAQDRTLEAIIRGHDVTDPNWRHPTRDANPPPTGGNHDDHLQPRQ